jgi:hypothetical protein
MKRLPAYLEYIRLQPCLRCGRKGGEAHHEPFGLNAVGAKPPDTHAIPLCPACHRIRHQTGQATFWDNQVEKILPHMLKYLTRFFCGERR